MRQKGVRGTWREEGATRSSGAPQEGQLKASFLPSLTVVAAAVPYTCARGARRQQGLLDRLAESTCTWGLIPETLVYSCCNPVCKQAETRVSDVQFDMLVSGAAHLFRVELCTLSGRRACRTFLIDIAAILKPGRSAKPHHEAASAKSANRNLSGRCSSELLFVLMLTFRLRRRARCVYAGGSCASVATAVSIIRSNKDFSPDRNGVSRLLY